MFYLLIPLIVVVILHFFNVELKSVVLNVVNEDSGTFANNFLSQINPDVIEQVGLR